LTDPIRENEWVRLEGKGLQEEEKDQTGEKEKLFARGKLLTSK